MCGGGGSVPAPDPAAEARAQIELERERQRIAAQQAAAEERRRAQEEARNRSRFSSSLSTAIAGTRSNVEQDLAELGLLDLDPFGSIIDRELNQARGIVPDLDPNPGQFFGPSLTDSILDAIEASERRRFQTQFDEFAPAGFATTAVPSTADDAIIDAILAEQFEPAALQIERARLRGNVGTSGAEAALDILNRQTDAARSRLGDIGTGAIEDLRGDLRGLSEQGQNRISSFDLGRPIDLSDIQSGIETRTSEGLEGLGGTIREILGDEQLFDVPQLLGRAGAVVGPENGPGDLVAALADRRKRDRATRGLGGQGVF